MLDTTVPHNPNVQILSKAGGWIRLSPLQKQRDPAICAGSKIGSSVTGG